MNKRIRQNGKAFCRVLVTVLILLSVMCGCSADWLFGDGRGDWTVELCGGYTLTKVNGYEIVFGHKMDSPAAGSSILLPNCFISAYQVQEPYIFLEGIPTKSWAASEEELQSKTRNYYLVNTDNGEISGPYESFDALSNDCGSLAIEIPEEWVQTSKRVAKMV